MFVFEIGCFVFEFWVLRFQDLGASFSSFGCFMLRSLFLSTSFSNLPWSYRLRGVNGFMVSCVSWFHRFRGVNGFMVSCVFWFHSFRGVSGFMVSDLAVSMVSSFHRFRGVNGFIVSCVSQFHRFRGVNGFMVSWCQWFHSFMVS